MRLAGFETILCPVDFSELSGHALRQAALLAACGPAKIVAAHAIWFEAPAYFTEGQVEELTREFSDSLAAAERALAAFVRSALGDRATAVETRVVEGVPADAILKLDRLQPMDAGLGGRARVARQSRACRYRAERAGKINPAHSVPGQRQGRLA